MPIATMPGGGQMAAPALRMPGGAALPDAGMGPGAGMVGPQAGTEVPAGAPGAQEGMPEPVSEDVITLDSVVPQFQGLDNITGQVFLVGEIVQGQTDDDIEVSVTEPADRQTIVDGLPDLAARLTFHTVTGTPGEPHMEVTPGATGEMAGEEPDLSEIGLGGE